MSDKATRTLEGIRPLSVTVKNDFHEILINLDSVNCRRFVNTENPIDWGGGDSEAGHELE